MALNAEQVVIELEAKVEGYLAPINNATKLTQAFGETASTGLGRAEDAATGMATTVGKALDDVVASTTNASGMIGVTLPRSVQEAMDQIGRATTTGAATTTKAVVSVGEGFTTTASSVERSANAIEQHVTKSSGGANNALLILQSVARRTADQFVAGAPVATILAEHIAGVAEAAEFAGGPVNLLGVAVSGGLGLAVTFVLPLLVSLAGNLIEGAEASDTQKHATESLSDAIQKLALASEHSIQTTQQAALASLNDARAKETQAQGVAKVTAAKLAQAKQDEELANRAARIAGQPGMGQGDSVGGAGVVAGIASIRVGNAATANENANSDVLRAGDAERAQEVVQLQRQIEASTSDSAAATQKYEDTIARLNTEFTKGAISKKAYLEAGEAATHARDAVTEAKSPAKARNNDSEAYAVAAANAKIATSTDDITRAQAELALVEAKRRSYTPAEYQAALAQAEANVNQAKSADELAKSLGAVYDAIVKTNKAFDTSFTKQGGDAFKDVEKQLDGYSKGTSQATSAAFEKQYAQQEQGVRTLANLYQDLFSNGVSGIWQDFEKMGEEAIAKLAAKKTFEAILSVLGGSGSSGGGFFSSLFGNDTGGSFTVGGAAGMDNNVLSINGVPQRRVSMGETVAIVPQAAMQSSAAQGANISGGSTSVYQSFTLDARYGITTSDLLQHVNDTAAQAGVFGAQAGGQIGYNRVLQQSQRPKLPGGMG